MFSLTLPFLPVEDHYVHRLTDHADAGDGMIGMEWCYYAYFTAKITFDKNFDTSIIHNNRSLTAGLLLVLHVECTPFVSVDHLAHIDLVLTVFSCQLLQYNHARSGKREGRRGGARWGERAATNLPLSWITKNNY